MLFEGYLTSLLLVHQLMFGLRSLISRAWLYNDPKILSLKSNAKVAQSGRHKNVTQRGPWVHKPLLPMLPALYK